MFSTTLRQIVTLLIIMIMLWPFYYFLKGQMVWLETDGCVCVSGGFSVGAVSVGVSAARRRLAALHSGKLHLPARPLWTQRHQWSSSSSTGFQYPGNLGVLSVHWRWFCVTFSIFEYHDVSLQGHLSSLCGLTCLSAGLLGYREMLSRRCSVLSQSSNHSWRRYSDWRDVIRW